MNIEIEEITKIKEHFKKHKIAYLCAATGIVSAGITFAIMRGVASQSISVGTSDAANGGISVVGKKVVMSNVSIVNQNRQGSPSWVVRCLDTNDVFMSQKQAALTMDIPQSELSKHLNGVMNDVRGYHFERICMAA